MHFHGSPSQIMNFNKTSALSTTSNWNYENIWQIGCSIAVTGNLTRFLASIIAYRNGNTWIGLFFLQLWVLLIENVGAYEKVEKQDKVSQIHNKRIFNVFERNRALGRLIGLDEPCMVVDQTAEDHLQQLQCGYELGYVFGHVESECFEGVVGVHDRMDKVVHACEPSARRAVIMIAVPAVHQHGRMMIPVEEYELLLAQHYEHGVHKLDKLAHHKQKRPEAGHAIGIRVVADWVLEAVVAQRMVHFGH